MGINKNGEPDGYELSKLGTLDHLIEPLTKDKELPEGIGTCMQGLVNEVRYYLTERENRPEVVCMCGSSRFVETMAVLAWEFEKDGKIVLSLHLLPQWYTDAKGQLANCDHQAEAEGVADAMDELHFRKIEMADTVFVVNVDGYIGKSTTREIAHATQLGKRIAYLEGEVSDGQS